MHLKYMGWDYMGFIYLAEHRGIWRGILDTVMKLRVSTYCGKFRESVWNCSLLKKDRRPPGY
jgi:hypothetical protein